MQLKKYICWQFDEITVRNYGGNMYNVFIDDSEVDVFTLYSKDEKTIEKTIKEYIKETLFNQLF